MDIQKIITIIQMIEDRAVTPEEGVYLLDAVIEVLRKIRPQIKKWWFRVLLDGVIVSLSELQEHLKEIAE